MIVQQVRSKVLARRGRLDEAEELIRSAVASNESLEMVLSIGQAYEDLGEVLALRGRLDEAERALERALDAWKRKGATALADRVRDRLGALRDG
jgi:tetratricopeptide (TPR) repeat protein